MWCYCLRISMCFFCTYIYSFHVAFHARFERIRFQFERIRIPLQYPIRMWCESFATEQKCMKTHLDKPQIPSILCPSIFFLCLVFCCCCCCLLQWNICIITFVCLPESRTRYFIVCIDRARTIQLIGVWLVSCPSRVMITFTRSACRRLLLPALKSNNQTENDWSHINSTKYQTINQHLNNPQLQYQYGRLYFS